MTFPNGSTAMATVVVDEIHRGGVGFVAAGPGSRSTAFVLAAESHPGIEVVMCIDERSAAFHALGWSKAWGRPSAVSTTSGTAVANLMPAVVEADQSGTPLLVVSSDRPFELRGVGANQTISQVGMFSGYVRSEMEMGPAEMHPDAPRWWRSMASQVLGSMAGFGGSRGPGHLNLSFREPTVPVSDDGRSTGDPYPYDQEGRPDGRPWTEASWKPEPNLQGLERVTEAVAKARTGVILAGTGASGSHALPILGRHLGWPVLATAESGLRGLDGVISTGHHLVGRMQPELILRFGAVGPSRRLIDLVSSPTPQVAVGESWSDPGRMASLVMGGDPETVGQALIERLEPREETDWGKWWRDADRAVRRALAPELTSGRTEPAVAAATSALGADVLTVASSMPIRDVEAYAFEVPPLVANRGASGIDGFASTALGAARHHSRPLALTGDLSLLHDTNGFLCDPSPTCVFVVIDNGGGGIFSFLPQVEHVAEQFERLFATPHERDLAKLAEFHHGDYGELDEVSELPAAVEDAWSRGGLSFLVARTDRTHNVAEHVKLANVVSDALASVPLPP